MLSHVKETIKDWMDKCKGIKLFLPLLMNPSTVSTCFEYQKHYSMKTKCVRPDTKNADNKTFAFLTNSDKLLMASSTKVCILSWRFEMMLIREIQRVGKEDFK